MAREVRSQVLVTRFTRSEEAAVLKAAAAAGVTVSAYLRSAALFALVVDGDPEGFNAVGKGVVALAGDLVRRARTLKFKVA